MCVCVCVCWGGDKYESIDFATLLVALAESPYRLLLAFCPKMLGSGRDL